MDGEDVDGSDRSLDPPQYARLTVMALTEFYVPGFRAGGPVRSLQNVVRALGGEFDFRIVTRDRDLGSRTPYPTIVDGRWHDVDGAEVRYLPPRETGFRLRKILREDHDVLYLNSFFSPRFTIVPLLLQKVGAIPSRPTVIAPRGEFGPGAIALKSTKKRAWMVISRILGVYRGLRWQASSDEEADQIRAMIGDTTRISVAPNIIASPQADEGQGPERPEAKVPGAARIVFLSRISPMKNLVFALKALEGIVTGHVTFDIYGPIEDERYWWGCRRSIESATSANVVPRYRGEVPHQQVRSLLAHYDLFVLPTRGENFGHVIMEALGSGCPVAVSDRTPWSDLGAAGAGWVLPLNSPETWTRAIADVVDANEPTMRELRSAATRFARDRAWSQPDADLSRRLFLLAARSGSE
jgi:glycosyltransferase involved in cell wall biosynthesis